VQEKTSVEDGCELCEVPPGWEIAPSDDEDVLNVCGNHPWQCNWLALSDGDRCGTSRNKNTKGFRGVLKGLTDSLVLEGNKVSASVDTFDVLLRRRVVSV
jgi:hypothetical protein